MRVPPDARKGKAGASPNVHRRETQA